jgi:uncharacterized delta-60 repeat protein
VAWWFDLTGRLTPPTRHDKVGTVRGRTETPTKIIGILCGQPLPGESGWRIRGSGRLLIPAAFPLSLGDPGMFQLFRPTLNPRSRTSQAQRTKRRPRVEKLEDRCLLTAGDVDLGYGGGDGVATESFQSLGTLSGSTTSPFGTALAVALQTVDGEQRMLVGGTITPPDSSYSDFFLTRFTASGVVDTSFGSNGVVMTDFTGGWDRVSQLLVTPEGKIVAVGQAYTKGGLMDLGIARYSASGALDTTFGTGGKVTAQMMGGYAEVEESPLGATLDNNGRLVVVGRATGRQFGNYGYYHAHFITRFTASGTLDKTFGKSGKLVGNAGFHTSDGWNAVAMKNSEIRVGGINNGQWTIARVSDKGAFLSKVVSPVYDLVAFEPDAEKVIGLTPISTPETGNDIQIARVNLNGTLDTTFGGGDGVVVTDLTQHFGVVKSNEYAQHLTFDGEGRILVAGWVITEQPTRDSLLVRYTASGELDSSFGSQGVVRTSITDERLEEARRVAVQEDGKIITAGSAQRWNAELRRYESVYDIALTRYLGDSLVAATDETLLLLMADDQVTSTRRK